MDAIVERYNIDNIYFGLDKRNIFKRMDRYRYKKTLIIIFSILSLGNLHEVIFNFVYLVLQIDTEQFIGDNNNSFYNCNLASEYYCDVYMATLLILCWHTFTKLKIETKIYY